MLSKRKITFAAFLVVMIVSLTFSVVFLSGRNIVAYATNAIVGGDKITVKEGVSDSFDENKTGISLSATENGAKADFGKNFTGKFVIDLKAKGEKGKVPALKSFSLVFTEIDTGDSFALKVAYSEEKVQTSSGSKAENCLVTDLSVVYNDQRAGIYYKETNSMPYELTSGHNNQGKHTRFYYGENAVITFDAENLVLSVADKTAKNQSYVLKIWDFKNEVNDGKKLTNNLDSFFNYNVSVVFDEITAGKTGELVVYSVSDGTDNVNFLKQNAVVIDADVKYNAVVGKAYTLPEAVITKTIKDNKAATANVTVKSGSKNIQVTNGSFTPDSAGEYTITYSYSENGAELAVKEYKIEAVASVKNEILTSFEFADVTIGINEKLAIPSATLKSNLAAGKRNSLMSVAIKKDGTVIKESAYEGFDYAFKTTGTYEIVYSNSEFGFEKSYVVTVSADKLGIADAELSESYLLGETLNLEPIKAYFGGKEYISSVTLNYPSAKKVVGTSFNLNELGNYKLLYNFSINGETLTVEKEFAVEKSIDSAFTFNDATVKYGTSAYNSALDGAIFTVKNNTVITYSEVLDVKKMFFNDSDSFNNKNNTEKYIPLIEIAAVPSMLGSADLTTIFITLTDVDDSSNTMSIRLRLADAGSSLTKIRAKGKNQTYTGQNFRWNSTYTGIDSYKVENAPAHEFGGFSSSHNFTQSQGSNKTSYSTCKLYYDYENNAVYGSPAYPQIGQDEIQWLICDFDSDRFFGVPWTGFRRGLATLSVSFSGVEGSADILIRSVNGEKFSGETLDDEIKPVISVDFGESETAPLGQVGVAYNVPDFTVEDNSGIITAKGYKVFFGDKEIKTVNGSFTPESTGYYAIEYSATDSFGNIGYERVVVRVMSYVSKPILEVEADLPETAQFGDVFALPQITVNGGAGNLKKTYSVTCNGVAVAVSDGELECKKTGMYIVTLKVTDHLGKTDEKVWFINVTFKNSPAFNENELVLPPSFIAGEEFEFAKYYADYYVGEDVSAEKVAAKITVNENGNIKAIGADGKYTPSSEESLTEVTVTLTFERENAEATVAERTVPVTHIVEKTRFMEKYFLTENTVVSSSSKNVEFRSVKSGDMKISFIRPVSVRDLAVVFDISALTCDYMTVTLTDSKNAKQTAVIKYGIGSEKGYCDVGGNKKVMFLSDGVLSMVYNYTNFELTDKNDVWSGTITENSDGSPFAGFDSGYVYMSITVHGSTESAAMGINSIGGQNFNYLGFDMVKPTLRINGNLSGKFGINSKVTTPVAEASDILFAVKNIRLTVVGPDEEELFSGDATRSYEITLGKYGIYQFIYDAFDASKKSNIATATKTITVYDSKAPELKFDREMIKEITVGYKYVLPGYTIIDNEPAENSKVHITVITPRGLAETVTDGTVKFLYKGTYKITFFVIDADGNNNLYSFEVVAKEG